MDPARIRQMIERARRRPPPSTKPTLNTPEKIREAARANLARLTPPPPPDPMTGRVIGRRL